MYRFAFWLIVCFFLTVGGCLVAERMSLSAQKVEKPTYCGVSFSKGDIQIEELKAMQEAVKDLIISTEKLDTIVLMGDIQDRYIIDDVVIAVPQNTKQTTIFNKKATIKFGAKQNNKDDVIITKIKTADGKFKIEC